MYELTMALGAEIPGFDGENRHGLPACAGGNTCRFEGCDGGGVTHRVSPASLCNTSAASW